MAAGTFAGARKGTSVAVVLGDRIGDSRKLSSLPLEDQDAYARMVSTLPDAFGRFRLSWTTMIGRLYPRLEGGESKAANRWRKVVARFLEVGLLREWELDGARFVEVVGFPPRRPRSPEETWHRTPEPPWSAHVHDGRCLPTAIARARDFKLPSEELSARLKELRSRPSTRVVQAGSKVVPATSKVVQATSGSVSGNGSLPHSDLEVRSGCEEGSERGASVPSVPSVPSGLTSTEEAPQGPGVTSSAHADGPLAAVLSIVRRDPVVEVFDYWVEKTWSRRGTRPMLSDERRRQIATRLAEERKANPSGDPVAGLKLAVDGSLADPYFNGTETGKKFQGFENVFVNRGRNRIEKLQAAALAPPPVAVASRSKAGETDARVRQLLADATAAREREGR